ncbi:methyltransferase type 11 [Catellatospora sp. TT07R-123]|uniref:class I SAM-dependent methyltransferase n=1 Tax=Catellatospora sp. TT07R-123 TaxID=2733863 RepID=UPI001B079478|nr:class I SAM-dependent methyltransferase [Catellatospora sp. TT07R-123]GHJ44693.1 methyltransferase type 11 [Catellatospora sp. TT07R-123]
MSQDRTFDELLAEGAAAPVDGWDFSWFAGRATEQRPPWGYAKLVADRMATARAALDLQTGGGEVTAELEHVPPVLVATEGWAPNLALARRNLARLGATVVEHADREPLPFPDASFDLVVSRHPTVTDWAEVARVLAPGGTYLSQQIGPRSVFGLAEFFLGPLDGGTARDPETAAAAARATGLDVADLRSASLRTEFFDVAAVVVYLRKVIWIVPGFDVATYRDRLRELHELIGREGSFTAYSARFLIEARKPAHLH